MRKRSSPNLGEATVLRVEALSPHMLRLTFRPDHAELFSPDMTSGYFKLLVPEPGEAGPPQADPETNRTSMRTYTLRHARSDTQEVDIDFVVHGDEGITGPWAAHAKPGDRIKMGSPKPVKFSPHGGDWCLFVADMAAIPAAAAFIETLDPAAVGDAFFEILSEDDRQPVDAPEGVKVHWIVKSDPFAPSDEIIKAVKGIEWREGEPSVFVAGEFSLVGALRSYFRNERPTQKELTYISSYWKSGLIEPEHKRAKAQVA